MSFNDVTPSVKKTDLNYVDVLDEDKPLAGQKFSCVSFISPEKILKQRDLFNFQAFLKQWELSKSMEKYTHFLSFLAYKYSLSFDNLTKDLADFCTEEQEKLFANVSLEDQFKNFLDKNEAKLDDDFQRIHNFQTSVRGLKVRGSYPTQEEAELRCKMLREVDPNHDVYVGPVGMWMPFHPEAYKTGRVEYLEEELNQLMHEKNSNEAHAKTEFEKRVRETKEKAMEDNKKKALESGNVLTQTINAAGQLVSVKDMNTTELEVAAAGGSLSALRQALFEGENVVTSQGDHGLSRIAEVRELPSVVAEVTAVAAAAEVTAVAAAITDAATED